jgi:hypothetical protein
MTEPTNFKITWGDEETVVEGRAEAVAFAKSKSNDVPMSVNVDSIDESASSTISMTYNGGSLEVYVAETRSNDRRPRKRDRNEEERSEESTEFEGDEVDVEEVTEAAEA